MLWKLIIIHLVCEFFAVPVIATCNKTRYAKHEGVLVINSSISSQVSNFPGMASKQGCLMLCRAKGCVALEFQKSSKLCRLLLTVPEVPGSVCSNQTRRLGTEAQSIVLKIENLDELMGLNTKFHVRRFFTNASTGRHGAIQQMTINVTGCYRVKTAGAKGGDSFGRDQKHGGRGALIAGNVILAAGTQLSIVVGQAGGTAHTDEYASGGGGGGGSFVYRTSDNGLLMAAGGGGGASYGYSGRPGEAGTGGSNSVGTNSAAQTGIGGVNGQPGSNDQSTAATDRNPGGCGAGWLGKPTAARTSTEYGDRGGSRADGWVGGRAGDTSPADGGFGGGGGGGAAAIKGAAGAGGGYSGGGAGSRSSYAGGGGGSFCGGIDCMATTGGNIKSEHGFVLLRLLVGACN